MRPLVASTIAILRDVRNEAKKINQPVDRFRLSEHLEFGFDVSEMLVAASRLSGLEFFGQILEEIFGVLHQAPECLDRSYRQFFYVAR